MPCDPQRPGRRHACTSSPGGPRHRDGSRRDLRRRAGTVLASRAVDLAGVMQVGRGPNLAGSPDGAYALIPRQFGRGGAGGARRCGHGRLICSTMPRRFVLARRSGKPWVLTCQGSHAGPSTTSGGAQTRHAWDARHVAGSHRHAREQSPNSHLRSQSYQRRGAIRDQQEASAPIVPAVQRGDGLKQ